MSIYTDIIYVTVALLLTAIVAIIAIYTLTAVQTNTQYNNTMTAQGNQLVNTTKNAIYVVDYAGAILIFGVITIAVISSAFIPSHPLFFVAGFITMLIFTVTSTMYTFMYNSIASNAFLAPIANNFTWTLIVFQNIPIIGLIAMVAIAIATHGKPGGRQ